MSTTLENRIKLPDKLIIQNAPPLVGDLTFERDKTWDEGFVYLATMPMRIAVRQYDVQSAPMLEPETHDSSRQENNMSSGKSVRSLARQSHIARGNKSIDENHERDDTVTSLGLLVKLLPLVGLVLIAVVISQSHRVSPLMGFGLLFIQVILTYIGLRAWVQRTDT